MRFAGTHVTTEPRLATLLLVVGLVAASNPVWLFPHEGDEQYTYERSEITVENGTFDYRPDDRLYHHENDLVDVGCQRADGFDRACSFDRYLLAHGPVTVRADGARGHPEFVVLDGDYYRRVAIDEGSNTTYDVERVAPRELLAAVATNVSIVALPPLDGDLPMPDRVAVTGKTVTTFDRVPADELGLVYRRNDSYYTVVLTTETHVDAPLLVRQLRDVISVVGLSVLVGGVVLVLGRFVGPDT